MQGLSQQKVSALLGLDESTVQGWEAGEHEPTGRSLELIERFLETCGLEYLRTANTTHPAII